MVKDEILKAVFPFLGGRELACCMMVSKQWNEIAKDDYHWRCVCAKKWPSTCKREADPLISHYNLCKALYNRKPYCRKRRVLLPPELSFNDLEFYIDIFNHEDLVYSRVIQGRALKKGFKPAPELSLDDLEYRMAVLVDPKFCIPQGHAFTVSLLIHRNDSNKMAYIINRRLFNYLDRASNRVKASDYLEFSPLHPFIYPIRAWLSLLFTSDERNGAVDVFGIQLDFGDVATWGSDVLRLLQMLDWK